jgi:endonuclease I
MKKLIFTICFLVGSVIWGQNDLYYSSINPNSTSFISELQTRIRSPYTRISYDLYDETNVTNYASRDTTGGQRVVTCVYSGENYVYTPPFAWGRFSREHTWCHSWMPTYPATNTDEYCDQHHLFPTNQNSANGVRNNHPLGEVVVVTSSYLQSSYGKDINGNNVFEPRESHKGDAARALLYMSLRYNGINGNDWTFNTLNNIKLPSLSEAAQDLTTLIQWHLQDPPDKWEVERNDYIESIQKNRNPFVDHPEYVNYIDFNNLSKLSSTYAAEPTNFPTSFMATLNGDKTEVTLSWSDAVAGIQAPQGYLIIAYDKDAYFIPVDGSTYGTDTDLSDGKAIVYVDYSAADNFTFTGINPSKHYYFTIYSYNGANSLINYKIGGAAPTANTVLPVQEPSNYPTEVLISDLGYTNFKVNWNDAVGTNLPDGYLILVNTTGTFTDPVDGTTYNDYLNADDGVAIANVSYSDINYYTFTGFRENTTYYIKIYSYAGSGSQINYKTDGLPPTANGTTLIIPEPANYPTNLNISEVSSTGFKVNWDEAVGAVLPDGYWIMINTMGVFANPADGNAQEDDTDFEDGSGAVHVSYSDVNYYSFAGLIPSTTYYVKVFTYCGDNFRRNYKIDGTAPTAEVTTSPITSYTVSLLDDFNRANSYSLGNCALGIAWNETEAASDLVKIDNNLAKFGTHTIYGREYAYISLSAITNYPTTLNNATKLVTWSFNMMQTRSDPSGFDNNNYGVAFILAASTTDITTANGYAVILGNSDSPDPIKLVYFTNGINKNSKITPFIAGSDNVSNKYSSIKVTYNPTNNLWSLYCELNTGSFYRNDTRLTNTLIGSATNNTFTNISLPYLILLYNHSTGTSNYSIFDDIYVSNPENMLPVELHSFEACRNNDKVMLTWRTDTEINNLGFEIQKQNLNKWESIGFVNGKGNSNVKSDYSFMDINKSVEKTAYRLKQVDIDGNYSFSEIAYVEGFVGYLEYKLFQNFPNPFNPSTIIKYQIPKDGIVELKLYDILGNEITTLLKEYKTKGEYTYNFDSNNLAAGVYVYLIKSGEFIDSKKMILLK